MSREIERNTQAAPCDGHRFLPDGAYCAPSQRYQPRGGAWRARVSAGAPGTAPHFLLDPRGAWLTFCRRCFVAALGFTPPETPIHPSQLGGRPAPTREPGEDDDDETPAPRRMEASTDEAAPKKAKRARKGAGATTAPPTSVPDAPATGPTTAPPPPEGSTASAGPAPAADVNRFGPFPCGCYVKRNEVNGLLFVFLCNQHGVQVVSNS